MDVLVEFRAGKMTYEDKLLKSDARKGTIRVAQDEHGLTHLQWAERDSSEAETDVIVFPGEATFEKIKDRRVFLLKFHQEPSRNVFFWAQEPDAEQDEDYVAAINNLINASMDEMEGVEAAAPAAAAAAAMPAQPAAAAPPAVVAQPAAAAGGAGGEGPISGALLASVLSNIMGGGGGAGAAAAALMQQRQQELAMGPPLGLVLKPELVVPLLQSPDMLERLAPFLPEQQRSREAMTDLISSPQFRHQLSLFSHALMTGQLDLSQFGLQGQGMGFGVLEFLRAIQHQADVNAAQQQQQRLGDEQAEGQGQ